MTSILDQLTKDEFTRMMDNVNASQLRVLLEAERKKNAELMAQVEKLRVCITMTIDKWAGVTEFEATALTMQRFLDKTPAQCLAERDAELQAHVYFLTNRVKDLEGAKVFAEKWEDEHDAKIAKAAFIAGAESQHCLDTYSDLNAAAEQYVNQIRQAKGDKQ